MSRSRHVAECLPLAECHASGRLTSADDEIELDLPPLAQHHHPDALLGAEPGIGLEHPVRRRERDAVERGQHVARPDPQRIERRARA